MDLHEIVARRWNVTSDLQLPLRRIYTSLSAWAVWIAAIGNMCSIQMVIVFAPTYLNQVIFWLISIRSLWILSKTIVMNAICIEVAIIYTCRWNDTKTMLSYCLMVIVKGKVMTTAWIQIQKKKMTQSSKLRERIGARINEWMHEWMP